MRGRCGANLNARYGVCRVHARAARGCHATMVERAGKRRKDARLLCRLPHGGAWAIWSTKIPRAGRLDGGFDRHERTSPNFASNIFTVPMAHRHRLRPGATTAPCYAVHPDGSDPADASIPKSPSIYGCPCCLKHAVGGLRSAHTPESVLRHAELLRTTAVYAPPTPVCEDRPESRSGRRLRRTAGGEPAGQKHSPWGPLGFERIFCYTSRLCK